MREIILVGAGPQAKSIITAARHGGMTVRAIYDDDVSRHGSKLLGVEIVGPISAAPSSGLPAVLGIMDPQQRKATAEGLPVAWATIIHPKAFLHPSVQVGPGTVISEGTVVQPSVTIGRHAFVAANATIAHDCTLDDFVNVSAGVDLAGNVHVHQGATLSVGAVVIPNLEIGAWTTIGPRAVVIKDVPDNERVRGVPASPEDDYPPRGLRGSGGALALCLVLESIVRGFAMQSRRQGPVPMRRVSIGV